ncbi:E3 ubiquitin-protein ligase SINA-like 1 [Glycine soja]|nr:E3 ubiquitin-protein ligase SINA-like 1 [Glycine soja]KHN44664.1 E3 ubiquitin-protein ligase SINA-like 10 [Glycine soja]
MAHPAVNGGGDNGVPMILTDPDVFVCCGCRDTLTIPIYECSKGHVILCSPCCNKHGYKCPFCSMFIGDKRCRAIEAVMESMKTVCCYAKHGCNAIVRYSEKRDHEKTCTFVPCLCPQPRCDWISNSNELGQHFKVKHFYKRIPFKYGEFFYVSLRRDTTTRVLQAVSDGKLFVISNDKREKKNSLILFHVGPNSWIPKFDYEVRATSDGAVLLPQTFVETTQGLKFEFSLLSFLHIPIEMWPCNGQIKLQFLITTVSGADKVVSEENNDQNGRPKRIRNRPVGLNDFYP